MGVANEDVENQPKTFDACDEKHFPSKNLVFVLLVKVAFRGRGRKQYWSFALHTGCAIASE